MFAGTYFSQQYWSAAAFDSHGLWPHADDTVRFPQLLADAGVTTVTFTSTRFMLNRWGCVRGFNGGDAAAREELLRILCEGVDRRRHRAPRQPRAGGRFFCSSTFSTHTGPTTWRARTARTSRTTSARCRWWTTRSADSSAGSTLHAFRDRTAVIITSDHGEAFGEHNSKTHGATLYDELLRVPLLIVAPGVRSRVVSEPVSLIDLGPTILDLMGQPTPSAFMGQSLVPFLLGKSPRLTRPIIAEGRLKRSLVLRSGLKVIVDDRTATAELYNLETDPDELHNLADQEAMLAEPLARLRYFFEVHTIQRPGYTVPYRR